ncbi:MAG: hypothetical protein R3F46_06995 [bacterium]
MSADGIVKRLMEEVPKAVAAGVVDMGTGMLIAVKTVESHPQKVLDLVAAATKDLFEGENVSMIEHYFKKSRGEESNERYLQEFITTSTHTLHVFTRLKAMQSVVLIVVARADANLGLAVMKTRAIAEEENI